MLRRQPVHRQGDEPVHVPQQEEGEERHEDHQQEEVPHVLEEIGRLAGAPVENESLHPVPTFRQEPPERGRRLGQLADGGVQADVDLPRQRGQPVHQRRGLRDHARPEQEPDDDQHGDDDREQRAHRHAPPDGQGIRPRDRRAQEIGERGGKEHGQEQAAREPGQRDDTAPREEPAGSHSGPAVSDPGPGSLMAPGWRRA